MMRADVGRLVERVAELQRLGLASQLVEEAVEDVGVQEQARARGAGLALPGEAHAGDDAVDHPVLVGVGIDDRRALAAELQRHRHDALGGGAHDDLADLGRAGERQLAHQRDAAPAARRIPRRSRSARSARRAAGTPGRPSAISSTPSGASSAAFSTSVLPAQSAGAIFSAPSSTGAFHGMIAPTTPSGSRRV